MTRYGVVGNRRGWSKSFVMRKLGEVIVGNKNDVIISGGAIGVDSYAQDFAKQLGLTIIIHYPDPEIPSPNRYFKRNFDIAKDCEVLIAFDKANGGAGTKNTIKIAKDFNRPTIVFKRERGDGL